MSKQWNRLRSHFGDWLHLQAPIDCDMVLVCVDTVQHKPITICLPHQVYVENLREIMKQHGAESVTIMAYSNDTKITITRQELTRSRASGPSRQRKSAR